MTQTTHEDPATIEREIRRTQENMSSTVDRIGDQFSIKNVFNALLDKADDNNVDARMLLDGARRNPVALGLIAAGAIWLVSDRDSKIPSIGFSASKKTGTDDTHRDASHHDYISHMSAIERRADEQDAEYQRRRDTARSNFFMVERGHDEDESGFRQRLDAMTDSFRNTRRAWANTSNDMQTAAMHKVQAASTKTRDMYAENPLVGGILAAAIGAAFGSVLPGTRIEEENLVALGHKALDAVGEQTEQMGSIVRDKKDELLDKADTALSNGASSSDETGTDDGPFMVRN
jgi:hypothetical protein